MDRRQFLGMASLAGGLGLVTWQARAASFFNLSQPLDTTGLRTDSARVFDLSVASGDPTETGVMLWTHIAPEAVRAGEPLFLQVALDAAFQTVLLQVQVPAHEITPERDHTVKLDLHGQLPAMASGGPFFYRFVYDRTVSRTGRCRTLPGSGAASTALKRLKFGLLTCQDYTNGYYGALAQVAADDSLDFVLHLGDFIYETAGDPRFQSLPFADRTLVLPSGGLVALNLDDYRAIYRHYRRDPFLQAALEKHTFIQIPDDHETANDCYWDTTRDTLGAPDHPYTTDPAYGNSAALLKQLKLDSQRAWSEYVPARVTFDSQATHPHQALGPVYRRFQFGQFLDLNLIENRTYRNAHPCGEDDYFGRYIPIGCNKGNLAGRTMLGATQLNWLLEGLTQSKATWKLMGNQTFFSRLSLSGLAPSLSTFNVDAWDGFAAERALITGALREAKVSNFVVATGDLHTHMASEIKHSFSDPNPLNISNHVGVEFMTPAVSSSALGEMLLAKADDTTRKLIIQGLASPLLQQANPHIRCFNSSSNGYSTLEFTDRYTEWVSYTVDKASNSAQAKRRALYRQRKYMDLPWLVPQSTLGW